MSNVGRGRVTDGRKGHTGQALTSILVFRCRFHVENTDRKLEEVLAWFSQAMGPTLAALYCAVGPEWITNVIQTGSSRWKPQHYQLMKKPNPKRPYLLKAT